MKRLAREDPHRTRKAERARGFTPPMPFCECSATAAGGYHALWCPVVGGGGLATRPPELPPSWHLGSGWVGCDCGLAHKMARSSHAFTCPVRKAPPVHTMNPALGMPYGSDPKSLVKPHLPGAGQPWDSSKYQKDFKVFWNPGQERWVGCNCPLASSFERLAHMDYCNVRKN